MTEVCEVMCYRATTDTCWKATYDVSVINNLIHDNKVLHVSFAPSPEDVFPAILPMIGAMGKSIIVNKFSTFYYS